MTSLPRAQATAGRSDWPIYVNGCHRSGTTLVRFILDAHPNIACPPETKFIAGLEQALLYPQSMAGLSSLGLTSRDVLDLCGAFVDSALRRFAISCGKRRWADKTPNYFRLLPFIDAMFDARAVYINIVRDPFDTVHSLSQYFRGTAETSDDPDISTVLSRKDGLGAWADYWTDVNSSLLTFAATCPSRCLLVRYEDLVSAPVASVSEIMAFLGEPMPPGIVDAALRRSPARGYEDSHIRRSSHIYTSRVGTGRSSYLSTGASYWPRVERVASLLAYKGPPSPDDHASAYSPADRSSLADGPSEQ